MKQVSYTRQAAEALLKHRNKARSIRDKIERYAETGAGVVTDLVGSEGKRLRIGDFRVIFLEDEAAITVLKIAPRGDVYD